MTLLKKTTYMVQSGGIETPDGAGANKDDVDRPGSVSLATSMCMKPLRKLSYLSGSTPGI